MKNPKYDFRRNGSTTCKPSSIFSILDKEKHWSKHKTERRNFQGIFFFHFLLNDHLIFLAMFYRFITVDDKLRTFSTLSMVNTFLKALDRSQYVTQTEHYWKRMRWARLKIFVELKKLRKTYTHVQETCSWSSRREKTRFITGTLNLLWFGKHYEITYFLFLTKILKKLKISKKKIIEKKVENRCVCKL